MQIGSFDFLTAFIGPMFLAINFPLWGLIGSFIGYFWIQKNHDVVHETQLVHNLDVVIIKLLEDSLHVSDAINIDLEEVLSVCWVLCNYAQLVRCVVDHYFELGVRRGEVLLILSLWNLN